ncbi:MAG: MOP flippase family protein [Candidatus Omnitrophica bacterium]|nr:MOP flippase family protein [Candidatus Omnitrophota bacterium]
MSTILEKNNEEDAQEKAKRQSLAHIASRSVMWNMMGSFGVSGIRFLSTAILARILVPADFGIVGMAYVVTQIVQLFGNLGLGSALIQKAKVDEEYLSTAYWGSVAMGIVLSLLGMAASPLAAVFFKRAIVQPVLICLSINFFIASLVSVQTVLLTKNLNFKQISIIEVITTIIRVAAILGFALSGFGLWSIVVGVVAERVVKTVIFYFFSDWRPKMIFDWGKFKELFHFGKNLFGSGFLGYFNANMDSIVTGRVLGAAELGYYQFAYNLPHLVITMFTDRFNEVLFPVYSKIQDDIQRVGRGYLKTVNFIAMFTLPIMLGFLFTAHDFILTVYGKKWLPSILPLSILCVSGAIRSINSPNTTLITALGRPDMNFKWSSILFPVTLAAIILGAKFGIIGVAVAMTVMAFLSFIMLFICLKKVTLTFTDYFMAVKPGLISALLMLTVLLIFNKWPFIEGLSSPLRLVLNMAVGALTYWFFISWIYQSDYMIMKNFVSSFLSKRKRL